MKFQIGDATDTALCVTLKHEFLRCDDAFNDFASSAKTTDDHGVEHRVKVRAESVYEAALLGLKRLERVGWESDGSTIGSVIVEVWEEPTRHLVHVKKLLSWPKAPKGQMGLASRNGRPSHWFVPWTRLGAGGAVSEVWELGSRAVRKILRNNSGLYWIGRFPILQLSFAIDSHGGRSFSQRSAQARRH